MFLVKFIVYVVHSLIIVQQVHIVVFHLLHIRSSCVPQFLFLTLCSILLVYFCIERVPLHIVHLLLLFKFLLLFVHFCLVLNCFLVKHFILFLYLSQLFMVSSVRFKLFFDLCPCIVCSNCLVLHFYTVETTLIN